METSRNRMSSFCGYQALLLRIRKVYGLILTPPGFCILPNYHPVEVIAFSFYLILPAALRPWIDSASNRNEFQKIFLGIKRSRRVRLTTSPQHVSRLSRQCGIPNVSQPYRRPRPVAGIALLYGDGVCFL
jgi:hypothetical protein